MWLLLLHGLLSLSAGSFTKGTIQPSHTYSPCPSCPTFSKVWGLPPPTYLLSISALLFNSDSNRGPFVVIPFMGTIPQSDSWHRIGWNFANAYIHAYPQVASGRCLCSLFPALSSTGVTSSQPYLPLGQYQVSLGHTRFFPTVSPANTLVRWSGTQRFRHHSAGSTILHLWPTSSSFGTAPIDYDPVVLRKPLGPYLAVGALPSEESVSNLLGR